MHAYPSFGQWLKKQRRALDLTQQELAQLVGCAPITVQKIEADERRPSKQLAGLLAQHLDIEVDKRPAFVRLARMKTGAKVSAEHALAPDRSWTSLSPRRMTNLPALQAALIGRDRDVAAVRNCLLDEDTRLLTLTGPPGVGKTSLAIQVATGLLDNYQQGVYWVECAPINDPNQIAATIARILAVNQSTDRSFADRLKKYLREKHMLLVLDNLEQVITAAPFLGELLDECLWLSILVTSRAPLRIRRERQFQISPLSVPSVTIASFDPTELMHYSAVSLFVERACAVQPGFTLTEGDAESIASICQRVDGLPLAIELVAARTSMLVPETLIKQLDGLLLTTEGLRDYPERHRTLYNAIDWSFALLTPNEQLLLARLSVFVGGFTLEAAQRMISDVDTSSSPSSLDILTSLVNSNLVTHSISTGEQRFKLLETIRQYAMRRLVESGEEQAIKRRHAEYYLALAEEADPLLRTAAQQVWLDRLEIEGGNLAAVLELFIDLAPDIERGLRLVAALGWFWTIRGNLSESRAWSTKALQMRGNAPPSSRARSLIWAAALAWYQGDLEIARSLAEESITLFRQIDERWNRAIALNILDQVAQQQGDYQQATAFFDESLDLFQKMGIEASIADVLHNLAQIAQSQGHYLLAARLYNESLDLFTTQGNHDGIAKCRSGLEALTGKGQDQREGEA